MSTLRSIAICLALPTLLQAAPAAAGESPRPDKVSFYFAAHEDDWQLFMDPSAFQDVINGAAKTVFIYTTAGDAGLGTAGAAVSIHSIRRGKRCPNGRPFHGRCRRHSGQRPWPTSDVQRPSDLPPELSQHCEPISCACRTATIRTGDGYYAHWLPIAEALADGKIDELSAIDGSTAYHGWDDLISTLRKIIDFERGRASAVQLNVAETDAASIRTIIPII